MAHKREKTQRSNKPQPPIHRFVAKPRTQHQAEYLKAAAENDIIFGIGPAGTGKTFLAVATAISQLQAKMVDRIIIARPAVQAGEELGFLPGTMEDKVNPYMRPIFDALFTMMYPDTVQALITKGVIEIAPVAFMRGRTLSNAFVLLDEAQNTTTEQMKMFLTRMGEGSRMMITGDITQIDLKRGEKSGLVEAIEVLEDVENIHFQYFDDTDVVRHKLVQDIVIAYQEYEKK